MPSALELPAEARTKSRARWGLHDETVGREAELGQLGRLLEGGARLVTLIGGPGHGKTRLARELGARAQLADGGDVWFCELASARTPADVNDAVARAMADAELAQGAGSGERLQAALDSCGECLLILDNAEQVVAPLREALGRWLAAAPDARFLVTSRIRLGLEAETVFDVPPLSTAGPAGASDAARLFLRRSRAAGGQPHASWHESVDEICGLLEGVPLALGLAASRAPLVGLDHLLARLRESPGAALDGLSRSIDTSWELLSPVAQRALIQCAAFRGGATMDELEAVLDLGRASVADTVGLLVECSLVFSDATGGDHRFRIPVAIADFGRARGAEELFGARDRHCRHFASEAYRIAVAEERADPTSLARLRVMRGNLLAALDHAVERGDAVRALKTALALTAPRGARLTPSRSVEELDRVLALPATIDDAELRLRASLERAISLDLFDREASVAACRALLSDERTPRFGLVHGRTHLALAASHARDWALDEAADNAREALRLSRGLADRATEARALNTLGTVATCEGDHGRALALLLEAVAVARRRDDPSDLAFLLTNVAILHLRDSHGEAARPYLEEAKRLFDVAGDTVRQARVHYCCGYVAWLDGELDEAERYFLRSIHLARRAGYEFVQADALSALGRLDRDRRRPTRARGHLERAKALLADRSTPNAILIDSALAGIEALQGRLDTAHAALAELRARVASDLPWRTVGCIDIEEARLAGIEARRAAAAKNAIGADEWQRKWKRRLARLDARLGEEPDIHLLVTRRGLEGSVADGDPRHDPPPETTSIVLEIPERRLRWLGRDLDLRRSPVLWRLLVALAQEACDRPNATLTPDELIETIWAGQRMSPSSARNRLHVAIATARRRLGADVIEWVEEGYRLAVPAAIRFDAEPERDE